MTERAPIDMTIGLNEEKRTFTTEEIEAVATNDYEQWIIRIPLLTFTILRGENGEVEDDFLDNGENVDYSTRTRVPVIARDLYTKQMNGYRLKYTPERLRELCYLRPLYPPQMDNSEAILSAYEFTKFTDKEMELFTKFMTEHGAEDKLHEIFEVQILKWTKNEDSDGVTYFSDEQKRLMGRRTVKTVASFVKMHLPPSVPDHEIREFHSAMVDMHAKNERYDIHIAKNAQEIITIYESANFSSCMKLGGDYIHHDLSGHPVEAYESPDIEVIGLFDKQKGVYVARCVTNANTHEYNVIYPNDGTGSRLSAANRLKRWLHDHDYAHNTRYLDGCSFSAIQDEDGWLVPYIDGSSPAAIIANNGSRAVFADSRDHSELIEEFKSLGLSYTRYAAQGTRGYVNSDDIY